MGKGTLDDIQNQGRLYVCVDGQKRYIQQGLVEKYHLSAGSRCPFSRHLIRVEYPQGYIQQKPEAKEEDTELHMVEWAHLTV